MHLLSQILLPVHLMSRDIFHYFPFPSRRSDDACLESMRRNLEGVISEEDNQDLVAFRPRAWTGGSHRAGRYREHITDCTEHFSSAGSPPDAAPLITVLFVDQKVLYLQIKTQGMIS